MGSVEFYFILAVISCLFALLINTVFERVKLTILIDDAVDSDKSDVSKKELLKVALSTIRYNKDETRNKLISAGIYNEVIADIYYFIKVIPFFVLMSFITYLFVKTDMSSVKFILCFLVSSLVFIIAPDYYVANRAKKNIYRINQRLPFLLDLMNICIHTGMTIEASLEYLAKELKTVDRDLAYVVQVTVDRSKVIGIESALKEFCKMVPTSEAQSFVMTILNNIQFGSSISAVLLSLASDIREINMLNLEEKVGSMGAKISIPMIIFIMIPIVVLIAAPGIMRMFN